MITKIPFGDCYCVWAELNIYIYIHTCRICVFLSKRLLNSPGPPSLAASAAPTRRWSASLPRFKLGPNPTCYYTGLKA